MLSIILMLLLLVGFFGLFAGLVLFSEGVIEPEFEIVAGRNGKPGHRTWPCTYCWR